MYVYVHGYVYMLVSMHVHESKSHSIFSVIQVHNIYINYVTGDVPTYIHAQVFVLGFITLVERSSLPN